MQPEVDTFLKTIMRSGLLNAEQLKVAGRAAPREVRDDPQSFADYLVRTGNLSRFQADKLLAGQDSGLLLGPFQVLAPIGRGGMGAVYLARDSRNQQLLALKVLPPKKARAEERMLARFRREMDLCQRVAHPHIARTFEVGVHDGVYYIAMEFIPGNDLSTLVRDSGPLTVPRAARLFAQVAAGLQHAHEQGLIHRDLKPSNIRVTPSERAKVLDLGLALLAGEDAGDREVVGGQGYIVGSMDYIAPEQTHDARAVDARADIYALGCSLYFALTGKPPFPGGTNKERIWRHRNEEPALLNERNPDVAPRFAELVHRMMAKDSQKRLASAVDAQRELLAWAAPDSQAPPDRQDDASFVQAVANLQAAEIVDPMEAVAVQEPLWTKPVPMMIIIGAALAGVGVLVALVIAAILLFG